MEVCPRMSGRPRKFSVAMKHEKAAELVWI